MEIIGLDWIGSLYILTVQFTFWETILEVFSYVMLDLHKHCKGSLK